MHLKHSAHRRCGILVALAATAGALLMPSLASASVVSTCPSNDSYSADVPQVSKMPATLIAGRRYGFEVEAFLAGGSGSVVVSATGGVNWREVVQGDPDDDMMDNEYEVNTVVGNTSPVVITVTENETVDDANWNPVECKVTVTDTYAASSGQAFTSLPRSIRRGAGFRINKVYNCKKSYAPTSATLQIRGHGSYYWHTYKSSDQCSGWNGGGYTHWFSSDYSGLFDYRLSSAGTKTRERGTIKSVVTDHYIPDRRIYAWHSDGSVNDEYWNVCVNHAKRTWMHNGNAYCVDWGSSWTTSRFRIIKRKVLIG